ncbi:MAG: ABC-F family ATP-binding cassette domain-containing protein [Saprospiraceae bacterium]|nr:ABC-F family ATP-binding cassette domain-containing protein [Saprospiraceae bacterium]
MISVVNVNVNFGERILLDSVNFTIGERDRIGLVGRNGAGKSTLMKIIADYSKPNGGGTIAKPNDATIGFLHQDMTLPKGKTVMQEALSAFDEVRNLEMRIEELNHELGERTDYESDSYMDLIHEVSDASERFHLLGGETAQADAERILKGLGFKSKDMDRPTEEFSGGWQMRVELAKMLLQRPDYLLLDEPTNHLDIESIIWLERFLVDYAGAVVLISHDKQFLDNITKRTIEVEMGKLYDYKANYSKYVEMRAERRGLLQNAYDNQQKMIAQREKTINRFMAKATKTSMAQSMQKQLDKVDRIELDDENVKAMNIKFAAAPRSGQVVVEATNLSKDYGSLKVLEKVGLKLDRGERVAFVGQNGQGKSTLAKILIGEVDYTEGGYQLGHNVQVGYYAQNQAEALYPTMTLLETMEMHTPPEMRTRLRSILGAFMFTGEDQEKKVSVLSGGERARLALACLLLRPFNLLLLDEPTNHLDMISKEVLKDALLQYDGTLIVVSHDREFLEGMADRTIEFRDKKLYEYLGDINYFLEKRELDNMRDVELKDKAAAATPSVKTQNAASNKTDSDKKRIERTIQNSEKRISDLEKQIAEVEKSMSVDNFYASKDAQKTLARHTDLKKQLETEMENWEMATMELEA